MRLRVLLLIVLTAFAAEGRRRAVRFPGAGPFVGHALQTVELSSDTADLAPLRNIVGNASIVGLGDATHGTHEFFALRLRMIDFLVREQGFDVVSIEGPFPLFERINVYAQGGPGDPRALLDEARTRLNYFFWDVEEMLAVIEWVRAYNAHRGERPPVEIAGADIYDEAGGVAGVLSYLRNVDPAAASEAETAYACVLEGERDSGCEAAALAVRQTLLARDDGSRAFETALQHANVVQQFFHLPLYEPREVSMAANLLWIREHRGAARKVVHWGHQEHVGRLPSTYTRGRTMGTILGESLGADYVAIGTLTGSGSFLQWERSGMLWLPVVRTFPDPPPGTYEWHFRRRGAAAMLVPLSTWSDGVAGFRTAGTTSGWTTVTQDLRKKLDAVVYVDRTTPTRPLG